MLEKDFNMQPVGSFKVFQNIPVSDFDNVKHAEKKSPRNDTIEISNTSKAFEKLDKFLNLGSADRLDTGDLNDGEKKEFLKMLSTLLQKGIVGYEVLEVNGRPEKHYIVNQIGDERLKGAKFYKKKSPY